VVVRGPARETEASRCVFVVYLDEDPLEFLADVTARNPDEIRGPVARTSGRGRVCGRSG
jgi:hypothetical protein